ncbi:NADH-ubiquinone oxidoreductase subunit NDUFA12 family protein [Alphaproteobacteria bacterium]|nr:NADH-ubiquinone oxidoreductase subunit NDUFA12 family protein [Alphaproteobacteria bacterium]
MSLGFKIYSFFNGKSIGNDTFGNTFFVDKKNKSKRWVIYANGFGPSSIPTNYHNWLHGTSDILPFFDTDKELTQSIVKQRVEKHINKKNKISSGYKAWKPK